MKITLTDAQCRALNDLRGLPTNAHFLVMTSTPTATGGVLEGSRDAYEELVAHIGEDLAEGMLSKSAASALKSLCLKIDPGCASWLGL